MSRQRGVDAENPDRLDGIAGIRTFGLKAWTR